MIWASTNANESELIINDVVIKGIEIVQFVMTVPTNGDYCNTHHDELI